jgi:hypothetical protein
VNLGTVVNIAAIVGPVVGVAAIVATVVVYLRQRRVTSVDFDILSDIKLIDSDAADAFANRLEVSYNSRLLRHPRIVDVKVINTGNTPVQADDYHEPIVFELDGGYSPIEAKVIAGSTPNLAGDIFETQPNGSRAISIRPPLLNSKDWFTLRMLFDNRDSQLIGSHRIVGGLPMKHYAVDLITSQARISRYGLAMWVLAIFGSGIIGWLVTKNVYAGLVIAGAGSLVAGVMMGIISMFYATFVHR